jgi:hypothetical protein
MPTGKEVNNNLEFNRIASIVMYTQHAKQAGMHNAEWRSTCQMSLTDNNRAVVASLHGSHLNSSLVYHTGNLMLVPKR